MVRHSDLHELQLRPIVIRALEEDWGYGDWTTDICVPHDKISKADIISRGEIIVAGIDVAKMVFQTVDPKLNLNVAKKNGDVATKNEILLAVEGSARSILKAERVALNFLGRMCGIATATRQFVNQLEGTKTQLLDTRKTTPGLRILEKSATVVGGARNHRLSLCDGVIVKENHIMAAGGIKPAVERLRESLPPTLKIEVEVTNLEELQQAIDAGADLIMLDNMSLSEMALAVRTARGRALLEASGNVTLDTVRAIAETGVDFISTGATVHSSKWADLSLLFRS
jgi:nicotinate-nucleotide pyrophosphorylase (carboxylating)